MVDAFVWKKKQLFRAGTGNISNNQKDDMLMNQACFEALKLAQICPITPTVTWDSGNEQGLAPCHLRQYVEPLEIVNAIPFETL